MIRLDDARVRLAETIFRELVDLPPDARRAELQQRCGSDLELCALVERLLECDSDPAKTREYDLLLRPAGLARLPDTTPLRIGRYEIVREIDRGGVGVVYEARQSSPHRRVALKVLQFFAPGPEVLRRFQTEAEALGQLNHPGIAQIYEAGIGDVVMSGAQRARLPFVAMEFVDGASLSQFVRAGSLSVPNAVELLADVCDAVHHAHQKGIIHRDLKPANILITRSSTEKGSRESCPIHPKVVDFGVARVTSDMRDRSIEQTQSGQLLGTLAYMSPEQLDGDARRIDTRSDVYSLGVIAYQLLAGQPPVDLSSKSLSQAIEHLRQTEIPPLSKARPVLRGDLDAIVAKALERDPERRYVSAAELAADLRRYLRQEPIAARPSSAWTQLRKFSQRNRALVLASGAAVVTLVAGIVATSIFAWREHTERRQKELEARRADRIVEFLGDMLSAVDPHAAAGAAITVRDVLDAAAERLDKGELADQPLVRARLHRTLGATFANLEFLAQARAQLEAALEFYQALESPDELVVIDTQRLLAGVLADLGEWPAAESLYDEALGAARGFKGGRHPLTALVLSDQSICYSHQGKFDEAEIACREALTLRTTLSGIAPLERAQSLANLGALLMKRGRMADAEPFLGEAVEIRRAQLPAEPAKLANALRHLGSLYFEQRRLELAEPLLVEALQIHRRVLDPGHPDLARSLNAYAFLLKVRDRNAEAVPLLREALQIQLNRNPDTQDIAIARLNLAHVLIEAGEMDEARHEEALGVETLREKLGPRNPTYASALHNVALGMSARGESAPAARLLREAVSIVEEAFGPEHDVVAHMRDSLGTVLLKLDCHDEALDLLEAALDIRRRTLGDHHDKTLITWSHVALARMRAGDAAGAAEAARFVLPQLDPDDEVALPRATALLALAEAMLAEPRTIEQAAQADQMLAEAARILLRTVGDQSPMLAEIHRVQAIWRN